MTLSPEHFDLEEAVDDVVTLLASKAAEKDIDLITHIHRSAPRKLRLDAGRLRQILTNLVGNAIKFTDDGHILIDVSASNSRLMIAVEDTGNVFPKTSRKRSFGSSSVLASRTDGHGAALTLGCQSLRLWFD